MIVNKNQRKNVPFFSSITFNGSLTLFNKVIKNCQEFFICLIIELIVWLQQNLVSRLQNKFSLHFVGYNTCTYATDVQYYTDANDARLAVVKSV